MSILRLMRCMSAVVLFLTASSVMAQSRRYGQFRDIPLYESPTPRPSRPANYGRVVLQNDQVRVTRTRLVSHQQSLAFGSSLLIALTDCDIRLSPPDEAAGPVHLVPGQAIWLNEHTSARVYAGDHPADFTLIQETTPVDPGKISAFFGVTIRMNYRDRRSRAHFHAIYGDQEAVIDIEKLQVLDGQLPQRALDLVLEWASPHKAELLENWNLAGQNRRLKDIRPLE